MLLSNIKENKVPPATDLLQGTLDVLILRTHGAGCDAALQVDRNAGTRPARGLP
jgi:hypothetical protein